MLQTEPRGISNHQTDTLTHEQKRSLSCTIPCTTVSQVHSSPRSPRIHINDELLQLLVAAPIIQHPRYIKYIAKGAIGKVFVHEAKVVNLVTNARPSWLKTMRILLNLKHCNVSSYLAVEKRGACIYVAECCAELKTVRTLIESARTIKRYVKESIVWEILYHVLSGLAYLHMYARNTIPWAETIVHGAITPDNILLLDDEVAVLSSCALWELFPVTWFDINNPSTYLMAPEVIVDPMHMTSASDIWSVGAVFYELLTLHPFAGDYPATDIDGLLQRLYERLGAIPPELPGYSEDITHLIRCMLHMDPRRRPSIEELLANKHMLYTKYRAARIQESATYLLSPSMSQMHANAREISNRKGQDSTVLYNNTLLTTKSQGLHLIFLNAQGETRLMQAVRDKKYAQLMTLIKEEAGVQSADGMTALMYAALFNNSLAINYLVDKEARLIDNDGNSALIFAIHSNFRCCAELLAPYEGGIVNNVGETALMYATRRRYDNIIRTLVRKETGIQNNSGDTALIIAIRANYKEGVRILAPLEKHIGLMDGTMPETLAVRLGFSDLGELIKGFANQ